MGHYLSFIYTEYNENSFISLPHTLISYITVKVTIAFLCVVYILFTITLWILSILTCSNVAPKGLESLNFVESSRWENTGVTPLRKEGINRIASKIEVDCMNNQFISVFTEDYNKGVSPYPHIQYINITNNGTSKLLTNIKPDKAVGPDSIPPRLLNEIA